MHGAVVGAGVEERSGLGSNPDHYPTLAMSLWQQHELGYLDEGASPTTIRGPGFPSWLAVAIALDIADGRWLGVWAALPTIAITAGFAAWLTRRIGARHALLFGFVTLMHPLPAFVSSRTMSDEFYAALGLAAVWSWVTALSPSVGRSRWRWVVGSGAALALQVLTRPTGLLTLGAIVVVTLLATRRAKRDRVFDAARSRWRELSVLVLLALLPALAWSVRSSKLEGRVLFVHSLAAYNFWYGEALDRLPLEDERGRSHGLAVEQILRLGGKDPSAAPKFWYGTLTPRDVAALETRLSQAARENIVEHPLQYTARVLRGMVWFWVRAETKTRTLQYVVAIVPLLLLALYGAWRGTGNLDGSLRRMAHLSVGLLLAHDLAYAATLPMARMCVQVFPLLTLLAVLGVRAIAQKVLANRQ
ncbi:MAG: hypothetical protein U0V87_09665 [Acidobacteriota bacterium]